MLIVLLFVDLVLLAAVYSFWAFFLNILCALLLEVFCRLFQMKAAESQLQTCFWWAAETGYRLQDAGCDIFLAGFHLFPGC
ncbi:hypothetical protein AXF42_Ash006953 [Apostasia shenzhenica]|uniref:Uncharacterized protein n=1 Tax=Apostasia shenzhenica TaxID=1088818 RepID=A0A2I0BER6_9ASPA|nr:hypothetical protein AXF42_Ash006953 [Apostasia shenzhenica]